MDRIKALVHVGLMGLRMLIHFSGLEFGTASTSTFFESTRFIPEICIATVYYASSLCPQSLVLPIKRTIAIHAFIQSKRPIKTKLPVAIVSPSIFLRGLFFNEMSRLA